MIFIESKKKSKKTLAKLYPFGEVIDLTSKGKEPFVKLSPFYPHGNIPVPFSENVYACSVEGIWQGLKVFEKQGIDTSKFEIKNMRGIKRTMRRFGKPLGHKKGVNGNQLLDYISARKQIYLPTYAWVLQNKTTDVIELLKVKAEKSDLIFLDFVTNEDVENINGPLSHAALVKKFIEKKFPELALKVFSQREREENEAQMGKSSPRENPKDKPKVIKARKKKKEKKITDEQLTFCL